MIISLQALLFSSINARIEFKELKGKSGFQQAEICSNQLIENARMKILSRINIDRPFY
jgi:hypothetical protein